MKLADNVKESLMLYLDRSPLEVEENWKNTFGDPCRDFAHRKMKDLFVFEEGDLEKYPDSKDFLEEYYEGSDLFGALHLLCRQLRGLIKT